MSEYVEVVSWYCTRRHLSPKGSTHRFLCGGGYGYTEKTFDAWTQPNKKKAWDAIPLCKSCAKKAGVESETPVLRVETTEALAPFLKAAQRKAWEEGFDSAELQDAGCLHASGWTRTNPYEGPYDPREDVPEPVVEPQQTAERDWRKEFGEFEAKLHDLMAEALGYPLYEPGEPGYSPDRPNYVTGDHTGYTLAMEAASKLKHERVRELFTAKVLAARIESYLKRATIPAPFPWMQPVGVTPMGLARAMLAEEDEPTPELPIGLCGNRDDHEPHLVESAPVAGGGPYWCCAEQDKRVPFALEG